MAQSDPHPSIRSTAVLALIDFGDKAAVPVLRRIALEDSDATVRILAQVVLKILEAK
jgi:HEAT repeat protein